MMFINLYLLLQLGLWYLADSAVFLWTDKHVWLRIALQTYSLFLLAEIWINQQTSGGIGLPPCCQPVQ